MSFQHSAKYYFNGLTANAFVQMTSHAQSLCQMEVIWAELDTGCCVHPWPHYLLAQCRDEQDHGRAALGAAGRLQQPQ